MQLTCQTCFFVILPIPKNGNKLNNHCYQLNWSCMCDTTWIGGVMWVNYLKKQCILILIQYLTLYCINLHIFTKQSCTEVLILQNIKIVYVWPKNTNHVCQHSFINLLGKIVLSIKVTILKVSLEQQKTFCS